MIAACGESKTKTPLKSVSNDQINWYSIEDIEDLVKQEPRPTYVMVYADWCPKCEKMNNTTFQNKKVIEDLNTKYYAVKLDSEYSGDLKWKGKTYGNPNYDHSRADDERNSYHELLFEIDAKSIPSMVFFDKELNIVGSEMGYQEPGIFRSLLHMYAN